MRQIAIQDANILIDLINAGLFDHCMQLNFQFITTSIIIVELFEEQIAIIQPHIVTGKFEIKQITIEELEEINAMSLADGSLSDQDCSAYYYARELNILLLTGDKVLRRKAEIDGIEVHGILWLFDQMVNDEVLSQQQAHTFLTILMDSNRRLPQDECKRRIKEWGG